ncbi:unnamed protein product [Leuciscus chuanchicus]
MLPYADDSEVQGAFMAQMECVCVPSALLFSFIPTDSSTTPSPWWFPDLKPPFTTIYTLSHRERDPPYMIHPQVLLGPHHRRMPICLGKEKFFLHLSPTAYQKHPLEINVEMLNCVLADRKQNVWDSEGQTTWRYIGQRSYEHVIGFDHSQKELMLVAWGLLDQECPVVPSSLPPHTAGSH